ncbi:hypothetical protein HBH56_177800 [Parastagonospora nodorum]|uniref:Uncharacterized protein n=2 Tax=Phaeosphaeria nodorum (strain SN15 / ATCC MYA-4574 / FGSC 10173) TaxID=321614 RepID=A0A7U2NPY3_PHANO|nr:hypothetical protein HBH56_177800 [Parastagonospora nodorum]QRD06103.1 hypothetical protein JI435_146720 [Parastagonospora nodorum SN15]KAH3931868.1 hypothetical protein HBH54_092010 [Parastagonospora nodorum]KAH4043953.1 hypothetical protein HBH49_223430 [Parastagonospora nodorum]KAH4112648.1 hypothetical protein HBH47_222910 [Parastagonospora nodorum]
MMPLPNDPDVQSAENARLLIVKRNKALQSLNISENQTDRIETELHAIGWTTALLKVADPISNGAFSVNDERALLCIRRYTTQELGTIRANFFPDRLSDGALGKKWTSFMMHDIPRWKSRDSDKVKTLWIQGKSFVAIAEEDFVEFEEMDLEIVFAQHSVMSRLRE